MAWLLCLKHTSHDISVASLGHAVKRRYEFVLEGSKLHHTLEKFGLAGQLCCRLTMGVYWQASSSRFWQLKETDMFFVFSSNSFVLFSNTLLTVNLPWGNITNSVMGHIWICIVLFIICLYCFSFSIDCNSVNSVYQWTLQHCY
jgi:hypothetical protein